MLNNSSKILIPMFIVAFGVAIYLDANDCKTLSDAVDILGSGKLKRLEQENIRLKEENANLKSHIRKIAYNERSSNFYYNEQKMNKGSAFPMHSDMELQPIRLKNGYPSYNTTNGLKSINHVNKPKSSMFEYRRVVNSYFGEVWDEWKKLPDLKDIDMVIVKITIDRNGKVLSKDYESNATKSATDFIIKKVDSYSFKPLPKDFSKSTFNMKYTFNKRSFNTSTL